jgi:hypothetical protein
MPTIDISVHPLDLNALKMLASEIHFLAQRAHRIGVPAIGNTLSVASDCAQNIWRQYSAELDASIKPSPEG